MTTTTGTTSDVREGLRLIMRGGGPKLIAAGIVGALLVGLSSLSVVEANHRAHKTTQVASTSNGVQPGTSGGSQTGSLNGSQPGLSGASTGSSGSSGSSAAGIPSATGSSALAGSGSTTGAGGTTSSATPSSPSGIAQPATVAPGTLNRGRFRAVRPRRVWI